MFRFLLFFVALHAFSTRVCLRYFSAPGFLMRQFSGLDDIRFSAQSIPEPGTVAITFAAGILILLRRCFKNR
jgi:hypothetical protein